MEPLSFVQAYPLPRSSLPRLLCAPKTTREPPRSAAPAMRSQRENYELILDLGGQAQMSQIKHQAPAVLGPQSQDLLLFERFYNFRNVWLRLCFYGFEQFLHIFIFGRKHNYCPFFILQLADAKIRQVSDS